ncbi:hypothetical protein ACFXJO_03570 [Streptomyces lavendulae]|uniref:hypothetical protein n=1 Tax=Streptomyces lavendulae TaxID=1914 RepID=UPI0036A206B8
MPTFTFTLDEVLAVATHSTYAPAHTLRPTYEQCQNEETVHAALWWVIDHTGTYLTGNSTHTDAPDNAYARGYGPGDSNDASTILGASDQIIDAIPLYDLATRECLHSDLTNAKRDGHDTLTITLTDDAYELRSFCATAPTTT